MQTAVLVHELLHIVASEEPAGLISVSSLPNKYASGAPQRLSMMRALGTLTARTWQAAGAAPSAYHRAAVPQRPRPRGDYQMLPSPSPRPASHQHRKPQSR